MKAQAAEGKEEMVFVFFCFSHLSLFKRHVSFPFRYWLFASSEKHFAHWKEARVDATCRQEDVRAKVRKEKKGDYDMH